MEKRFANFISYIFHPLLMPTYGLSLIFFLNSYISKAIPLQAKIAIIAIVFLNTALLPALIFVFMKFQHYITSLKMENRAERLIPFIVTAIFYFITFYALRKFYLPFYVYYLIFGSACLIVIALIINLWWKISIHMLGIGGLFGALICISFIFMANFILIIALLAVMAGFIGFSRIILDAHTPAQVYTGFVTGSFFMILMFFLF